MKNLVFLVLMFLLVLTLVKLSLNAQDKEYEQYSKQAVKKCMNNSETHSLKFDEDLRYWKCQPF